MSERIASFDWTGTALGAIEAWSPSLQAAVRLLLASPVPLVMLWGRPGSMIYNDAYSIFAGGRHPFLLGKPVEDGWPEIAEFNRNVVDTCLAGGTLTYHDKQLTLHRDGRPEEVWMDLHYSPVAEMNGQPAGVLAAVLETTAKVLAERERKVAEAKLLRLTQTLEERVAQAVTARVQAEERLRQVQKLEAIGNLTGGVVHDFNNVLQIISANVQLVDLYGRDNPKLRPRIDAVRSAVERGGRLASQLLSFARRQPLAPAPIHPSRLLDSMSDLLTRALPEPVTLTISLAPDTWRVFVDRNQLENALLNLVINSRDAINGAGNIWLTIKNQVGGKRLHTGATLPKGEYVRLSVRDSGCGMSESVQARMFEPFYSTKAEGQGTGLGLSMVFGFVSQSLGVLDVQTQMNGGTTVSLYFPRCTAEEAGETILARPSAHTGGETILVAEDDADVRLAAIDMLAQLGYRVLSAHDSDAALSALQQPTLGGFNRSMQ